MISFLQWQYACIFNGSLSCNLHRVTRQLFCLHQLYLEVATCKTTPFKHGARPRPLVLNWCKKFIKQPTVCSLHNLKSDCHKMTNTAVTEHYPRLGLFAALNYGAVYWEGCWDWTEEQRQDFPNMERHKPCYSRAKVFLPLGIISGNGSFVSKYLAWGHSHTSQTLRHSWMGGESSGSQWVVGISQNSCHDSWEAALVSSFWVEFVFLWCIFTNFVFEMRIVFRKT